MNKMDSIHSYFQSSNASFPLILTSNPLKINPSRAFFLQGNLIYGRLIRLELIQDVIISKLTLIVNLFLLFD